MSLTKWWRAALSLATPLVMIKSLSSGKIGTTEVCFMNSQTFENILVAIEIAAQRCDPLGYRALKQARRLLIASEFGAVGLPPTTAERIYERVHTEGYRYESGDTE